jgi:tRNA(Met) cytidine acetyltransferase
MVQVQDFLPWFDNYAEAAAVNNERRLILLSGCESWAMSLLHTIDGVRAAVNTKVGKESHTSTLTTPCLIYGDSPIFPANIQKNRYRDKLGSESDLIIFADSEFTIDAFAGLSGTLKAGGILFLVIPSVGEKSEQSLFFKRFSSLVEHMSSHTIITEWHTSLLPPCSALDSQIKQLEVSTYPDNCITEEQYNAVLAIKKVVSAQRKRPLVLTADRGRGKSSALAIACAQLMKVHEHDEFRVVITAPDIQALSVFYRQIKQSLMSIEQNGNNITFGKARLTFIAVDQLIREPIKVNLLLVDEAAAIPVYLLEQLLQSYHRMVFSSTVHGYEGAGRGFTLKFQKTLDGLCPQWVNLHLKQPIRWRENDPLEQLVFDACLLNAELPNLKATFVPQFLVSDKSSSASTVDSLNALDETVFKVITAEKLVADELLLKQVFAVLVTAHYQTKPSDLKLLLDNPQVQVTCLFSSKSENAD